jgi:hypothetical protein
MIKPYEDKDRRTDEWGDAMGRTKQCKKSMAKTAAKANESLS